MDSKLFKADACHQQLTKLRKISPLLCIDILIEVICFINKRQALLLASTSRIIKYFVEKLAYYPIKPRIVPELTVINMLRYKNIITKTYKNYTYVSFPKKVLRPGYYGRRIWRRLPASPPPNEIAGAGFGEISLELKLAGIIHSSDYITAIGIFFNNIRHLITQKTHFLHISFELADYICSDDVELLAEIYKNTNNEIYRIPEFDKVLDWLNLFDIGNFKFLRIWSSMPLLFSKSSRLDMLLSQLLDSFQVLSVTYLEIQNDICSQNYTPSTCRFQLSSITKWLFNAKGPKVLHLKGDHPDDIIMECRCPSDCFLFPLIKALLDTNWTDYSYLIIKKICIYCFVFNLFVGHFELRPYLKDVLQHTSNYIAVRIEMAEKLEIFNIGVYLYIRRSPMFGPIEKELDLQHSWNYFNDVINTQHAIKATVVDNIPGSHQNYIFNYEINSV